MRTVPLITTIIVLIFIAPVTFCCVSWGEMREPEIYEPELTDVMKFPPSQEVPPDYDVVIYAKVADRYSEIKNATLTYIDDKEKKPKNIRMQLIDGTFSNGTFRGVIPKYNTQDNGTNVSYALTFSDSLNYSTKYSGSYVIGMDSRQSPPVVDYDIFSTGEPFKYYTVFQGYNTTIRVRASDNESGIKNVTFYYWTDPPSLNSSIKMKLVDGNEWDGVYEGIVPSLHLDAKKYNFSSFFAVYDIANQSTHFNKTTINYEAPTWWTENLNKFFTTVKILDLTPENLTARVNVTIGAPVVNQSTGEIDDPYFLEEFGVHTSQIPSYGTVTSFNVNNETGLEFTYDLYNITETFPKGSNLTELATGDLEDRKRSLLSALNPSTFAREFGEFQTGEVSIFGSPSLYPFDNYYVGLEVKYPVRNPALPPEDQSVLIDNSINSSWKASAPEISIGNESPLKFMSGGVTYYSPASSSDRVVRILVDFQRNYTTLVLIIPLLAIFYLLGASFIFDNTLDRLGNRLALTLGIIALIFTLNSIIDRTKPIIGSPTIADSILSIGMTAAIVFPISSILSSSPIIQKRFRRLYGYIDLIMFGVMAGITIALLGNFDLEVTIWLIPVIIFGLGYGLLIRKISISSLKSVILRKASPDQYDSY